MAKIRRRKERVRMRRRRTSIFYLVWGAISLVCLIVVFAISVTQRLMVGASLRGEATQNLSGYSQTIKEQLIGKRPSQFASEEEHLRHLSYTSGLNIVLFTEDGQLLYAYSESVPNFEEMMEHVGNKLDVEEETNKPNKNEPTKDETSGGTDGEGTEEEVEKFDDRYVLYQGEYTYSYVSLLPPSTQDGPMRYLYVEKDVRYLEGVLNQVGVRTFMSGSIVFILAFAVAAGISGIVTKPIREIQGKAKLLAKGDFTVDFHGDDYGREMVELADSLNFARDELAKTDTMQKELIANVSHDFKTPLTMIKAYASMIVELDGDDTKKREKHAGVIVDEADRLASLVSDLLDLSKLQSGISIVNKEKFDVSAYTESAVEGLEYFREKGGYEFVTDIQAGLYIEGDKTMIGQVLHNLIGNAINYTGEDKKVYITLVRQGNTARFSVRDTGEGIAQEELAGIWDRYYRSGKPHKRPVQGTGLGLSIVRQVLEIHNFAFGAESKEGEGSEFYFEFPCVEMEN